MSISRLATLFTAPRKTISDWSNSNDHRHMIVEVLQEIGESELINILQRIEEREGIKRYSLESLMNTFISIFPKVDKLTVDYLTPENPFNARAYLLSKHKDNENRAMMFLFKNRLPNLIKLQEQVTKYYNDFLAQGIVIEITIFVDISEEVIQRKYREINPRTEEPYIPEYLILKNVREELKLDDKAILI